MEGSTEGVYRRESLQTRSFERATALVREIEDGKNVRRTTVEEATESFLEDAKARGLRASSLYKYDLLFRRLKAYAESEGLRHISDLDIEALRRWRATWTHKNFAAKVTTANLRAFMRFCQESGWLKVNPAKLLRSPEVTSHPVEPFTDAEMESIFKACDSYKTLKSSPLPIKAFVLLLRWSGLRITDAVTLERSRLTGDRLFLYTAKTGTPVHLPLPPDVVAALGAIPKTSNISFGAGTERWRRAAGTLRWRCAGCSNRPPSRVMHISFDTQWQPLCYLKGCLSSGFPSCLATRRHEQPSNIIQVGFRLRQDQVEQDVRSTRAQSS
jgi:integrase